VKTQLTTGQWYFEFTLQVPKEKNVKSEKKNQDKIEQAIEQTKPSFALDASTTTAETTQHAEDQKPADVETKESDEKKEGEAASILAGLGPESEKPEEKKDGEQLEGEKKDGEQPEGGKTGEEKEEGVKSPEPEPVASPFGWEFAKEYGQPEEPKIEVEEVGKCKIRVGLLSSLFFGASSNGKGMFGFFFKLYFLYSVSCFFSSSFFFFFFSLLCCRCA
jgi:hypothetical protein